MMDAMNHQLAEREAQRTQANREELVERIGQAVREDGVVQPLPGLHLGRVSAPGERVPSVVEPSFCVIAQGSKEVLVGDHCYQYDPYHYLLATVGLPRVSQVLEASKPRPYLSFRLELTPALVGSVMVETGLAAPPSQTDVSAIDVSLLDANRAVKKANGSLFPFGIIKLLLEMRKIDRVRTTIMGVLKEHRNKGYEIAMIHKTIENGVAMGMKDADCSLIVETNTPMISVLEKIGCVRYKTYRVLKKTF